MNYQIYFRIRRGGIGIPYQLAKTEFVVVFASYGLQIEREHSDRRRMWVALSLSPNQVAGLALDLGYTEAILHMHIERYDGGVLYPIERGRWHVGWVRQRESKVYQTEVYVQDAKSLLKDAPHRRFFQIEHDGGICTAKGHHVQRAVSVLDARFLFNIAKFTPQMQILDPFAGFGGIVFEAKRRGLSISASDIDVGLSPGLWQLAPKRYCVADARLLPYPKNSFDAIITEPPFRTCYRQAVVDSLPELDRILKPAGRIVLLIAMDMVEAAQAFFEHIGRCVELVEVIPRGGGLKCPVLRITSQSEICASSAPINV